MRLPCASAYRRRTRWGSGAARDYPELMQLDWVPDRLRPTLQDWLAALSDDPTIVAAWLGGSLARGTADDWSDIDLHLLSSGPESPTAEAIRMLAPATRPCALVDAIPGLTSSFIVITDEWVHLDVIVHPLDGFSQGDHPVKLLFDDTGSVRTISSDAPEVAESSGLPLPPSVALYLLGDVVTLVRRQEWLALSRHLSRFRDDVLIPSLLAVAGSDKRDGAKRLNRYLTDDHCAALVDVGPIGTGAFDWDQPAIALASAYMFHVKRYALQHDLGWPHELEHATRRHWKEHLGITLPE